MSSASTAGRSAGLLLLSPSLNPYAYPDPREAAWYKAWQIAAGEVIRVRDQERRRKLSSECSREGEFK